MRETSGPRHCGHRRAWGWRTLSAAPAPPPAATGSPAAGRGPELPCPLGPLLPGQRRAQPTWGPAGSSAEPGRCRGPGPGDVSPGTRRCPSSSAPWLGPAVPACGRPRGAAGSGPAPGGAGRHGLSPCSRFIGGPALVFFH